MKREMVEPKKNLTFEISPTKLIFHSTIFIDILPLPLIVQEKQQHIA